MEENENIISAPLEVVLKHALISISNSSSLRPDGVGSSFYITC